jgi:hypothetical protein
VEAALVLPVVLLFLMGIIEFGRWFMYVNVYNNATLSGAAYAAKHTDPIYLASPTTTTATCYTNTTTALDNAITSNLAGLQLSGQTITAFMSNAQGTAVADSQGNNPGLWTNAPAGQTICVQVTGTYNFLIPTLLHLPASVTLTFQSVKRSEGN